MRSRTQPGFRSVLIAAVLCCAPVAAAADPILVVITGGSFSFSPFSLTGVTPLQLVGTDGFSLNATPGTGATGPQCCVTPGTSVRFFGSWSSNDLPGTATFGGETFTNLGGLSSSNQARVAFESSMFMLPAPGQGSITITAPFTLTGTFRGTPGMGNSTPATVDLMLIGSGIGTLPFTFVGGPTPHWDPGIATLQLSTPLEAIPEPGSLMLIGLGLAGAYGARRRGRR